MTYVRKEELADSVTLYQGDCSAVLRQLPVFDAIVTDPPYGVGAHDGIGLQNKELVRTGFAGGGGNWDTSAPGADVFALMMERSKNQILWGGNYFPLRPSRGFLIWDKGPTLYNRNHAECEYAWCSMDMNARIKMIHATMFHRVEGKEHPTQKPVDIMLWCLSFLPDAKTICDPFMGSGTTGVACVRAGKAFTGIERDTHFFDVACRRLSRALAIPVDHVNSAGQSSLLI